MKAMITFLAYLTSVAACNLLGGGDGGGPRSIVFSAVADDEGRYQIYTMREDGSGVRQLTHGEYSSTEPAWSPDGTRIAYARSTGSTAGEALWVMDADGSNKQPLVTDPRTGNPQLGNHPAWSPDGTKLAFDRCMDCEFGGKNFEVFVADLRIGTIDTLTGHPVADRHPTWSPDGTQIAFASNRDYFDADTMRWREDLYMVAVDGNNLTRLTETGNATRPVWSPGENKIAYEWNIRENNVYLYEISSSQITLIDSGLQFSGNPMWNSNGTKLLVSGRQSEGASPEMRLLNMEVEPPEILQKIVLDANSVGRDYDWHDNQ